MKKFCSALVFFCLASFVISVDAGAQEEVGFLLFAPDSSNRFVNHERELIHLDNVARYLLSRNLSPGQISVHGYAAPAKNDIDPVNLSIDRAFFVMSELQKRGVPMELFSQPVGHGEVQLWGTNQDVEARGLNRRVNILIDGVVLPATVFVVTGERFTTFPWWLFLLPLFGMFVLLALYLHERMAGRTAQYAKVVPLGALAAKDMMLDNLDDAIRRRAYELYLGRNGQDGDANADWYQAVPEICARNEIMGYQVYTDNGSWWAHRDRIEYVA